MGDAGYEAATGRVAVRDRSFRARLVVSGRAPVRMLDGILTGAIPAGPASAGPGVGAGRASYSAVLTPKGRMVTDLRVLRMDPGEAEGGERLLLDVPAEGREGLREHLTRFVPPRFASVEDVSEATGMLTVLGPDAPELLSREALGLRVEAHELTALVEGDYRVVDLGGAEALYVIRTDDVAAPAWDVFADRATVRALAGRLQEAGARPLGEAAWETLRVERGRPAFGVDMDDGTIPIEAGIHGRAIDYGKGCYTGQEVIVRIRDRGHVNRHLRGLRLGDVPPPEPGTLLFAPDVRGDRPAGEITSAVRSPRRGEALALGRVRREIEPGSAVRVGDVQGPLAVVMELDGEEWSG